MAGNPIADLLAHAPAVVLDGGLATELERDGCDLDDPLWSARVLIERPDAIRAVHRAYFVAGADCATTASYQASFAGFAGRGLDATAAAGLMTLSVRLAVEARDEFWAHGDRAGRARPFVAASVGPYGAVLHDGSEYRGGYGLSVADLMDFHRPRMAVLVAAGADLLACETIPCRAEAEALARLLTEFPGLCAWISFSARDDAHISEGDRLDDCIAALDGHPQIAAVGVNCTAPAHIGGLMRAAGTVTGLPLLAYPNAGESYDADGKTWAGTEQTWDTVGWLAAGVRVIGGCCRTTPDTIRGLRALVDGQAAR